MIENNDKRNDKELEELIEKVFGKMSALMLNSVFLGRKIEKDEELTKVLKQQVGCNSDESLEAARFIINPVTTSTCDFIKEMPNLADIINDSGKKHFFDLFNEEQLAKLMEVGIALGIKYSKEMLKELTTLSSKEEEKEKEEEKPKKALSLKDIYNYSDKDYSSPEEFVEDCLESSQKELNDFLNKKEDIDKERIIALGVRTIKDTQGVAKDVKVYDIYTKEEVDWDSLDSALKETLISEIRAEGEEDVARILAEKDKKKEKNSNNVGVDKNEFLDFFSDILKGMDGER